MRYQDISIIVLVFATALGSSWTHDLPSQQHRTFEELTKVLDEAKKKPSLSFKDVETLFAKLNFENCTQNRRTTECWKCFTVSDLYRYFKFDTGSILNETNFSRVSPALVYHLVPEKYPGSSHAVCRSSILPENLFAAFAANFSGSNAAITLEALDKVLENVNETLGQSLTKKKCFSARSVLLEVKENSAADHDQDHDQDHESGDSQSLDEDEFQKACANILFHLVQGYCIEEDHGKLPPKYFFLDNIFENRTYFPEDKLIEVTKKLGIAELSTSEGDSHEVHAHRRRRSLDDGDNGVVFNHRISRRSTDEHGHAGNTSYEGKCYSLDNLFNVFDVDHSLGVTKSQLKELCPALLQQFTSSACTAKKPTNKAPTPTDLTDKSKVWGYGFAAVTIISVLSLIGVSTVPFVGKKMYKKVLALLVALAVGSLAGDALLHLMPHALGLHGHSEESGADGHGHGSSKVPDFIWKALVVIGAIYCFYLFETVMHFALAKKTGKHGHSHVDIEIPGPSSRHMSFKKRDCSNMEHHTGIPTIPEDEKPHGENGIVLTNISSVGGSEDENTKPTPKSDEHKRRLERKRSTLKTSLSRRSVFSQEEGFKPNKENGVSSYAWMIIIGDTIHNISDGLAIGAAFSEAGSSGITGGISTSIAVFCHELPHELGDFAVLLSAGMSVKMALLANFLSACSCYIGLVIGLQIGQMSDIRLWIFAVAAGMFLYVALVDMLPDLMHSESLHTDALATFILQNVGLLMGFTIMMVISVYEEDLRSLKF